MKNLREDLNPWREKAHSGPGTLSCHCSQRAKRFHAGLSLWSTIPAGFYFSVLGVIRWVLLAWDRPSEQNTSPETLVDINIWHITELEKKKSQTEFPINAAGNPSFTWMPGNTNVNGHSGACSNNPQWKPPTCPVRVEQTFFNSGTSER